MLVPVSQEGIFRVQVLCLLPEYRGEGDANFMATCEACSGIPPFGLPSWAAQAARGRVTPVSGGMSALPPRASCRLQGRAAGRRSEPGPQELEQRQGEQK